MRSGLVAAVATAVLATGGAAYARPDSLERETFKGGDRTPFEGTCTVSGKVIFPDEPLRFEPQDLTVGIEADGECEGRLDGESETSFRVRFRGYREDVRFFCGAVSPEPTLRGELNPEPSAGDDIENDLAGEITIVTSSEPTGITFEGRNGGELVGTFAVDDLEAVGAACGGEGNAELRFSATLAGSTAG